MIFENGMGSCNFPIKDRTLVRACVCVWMFVCVCLSVFVCMCVCVYVCGKTIISETRFIELFVAAYIFQMFVPHIDRSLLFSRCHVPFFCLFHLTSFVKLPGVKSFKQHFSDQNL